MPNQPTTSNGGQLTRRWQSAIAWGSLLLTIALIGIIDMPAQYWAGDPSTWREETRSIINNGQLAIDLIPLKPYIGEKGQHLVVNQRNGLTYSKFGLMNSLMILPPMLLDRVLNGPSLPLSTPSLWISNSWNIALSVALGAVLMRISGRYTNRLATRCLFVVVAFYCTFLWYFIRAQSSEIYQALFFAAAYLGLVSSLDGIRSGKRRIWPIHLAWLFVGMLVFTRVSYLLLLPLVPIFCAIIIARLPRDQRLAASLRIAPGLVFAPMLILILLGTVNYVKFGSSLLTGYHQWRPEQHLPTGSLAEGLWGFFLQPRFSIFLYFPALLIALPCVVKFCRRFPADAMVVFATAALFVIILAKIPTWAGEWTYGPRYLLFVLPVLSLPMILTIDWLIDNRKRATAWLLSAIAGGALLYSAYIQFRVNQTGFFAYYAIRLKIEPQWPPAAQSYFMDHHMGRTLDDLLHHRDDPDALPWFTELKQAWPADKVVEVRQLIVKTMNESNYYWWAAAR